MRPTGICMRSELAMPPDTDGPKPESQEPTACAVDYDAGRCRTPAPLRKSERRYRRLFGTAKGGVLILDTETGKVLEANPSLRVLVVDDNVDFAYGIGELLRTSGHDVKVAHSGREALAAMVDFHPDVAVLDIGMPGMDGYEVARQMRQDPDFPGLRVIGLSGQKPEGSLALGARFDAFLLKPVHFETMEASLRG